VTGESAFTSVGGLHPAATVSAPGDLVGYRSADIAHIIVAVVTASADALPRTTRLIAAGARLAERGMATVLPEMLTSGGNFKWVHRP